ncbi:MAG: MFS transporter [Clostridia bacterium]|nr:MFS transporter [Clostridia bacterium]
MDNKIKAKKLGGKVWFNLILFGLMGQIAWNVENVYFNTFLCNFIYGSASQSAVDNSLSVTNAVAWMVALSAVTAVVTSFIMGNLSDKKNNRRLFISAGYILWGIVTGCFGFVSLDNTSKLFHLSDEAAVLTTTVWVIVALDCLMTFMGSTSNDSAFNAWVTDITDVSNRTNVETALAAMPILAMGLVLAVGGVAVSKLGYPIFFFSLGAFVIICGVIGLFTIKDSEKHKEQSDSNYWKDLIDGFRPSVIKENSKLYLTLASVCIYSIALQVFFPYIIVYLQHSDIAAGETFSALLSPVRLAVIIAEAAAAVFVFVFFLKNVNRFGKPAFLIPSAAVFSVGLIALYFVHELFPFIVIAIPALVGYGLLGIILSAVIRDFTPESKAGLFQGVRMIFFVMIPMVIGPRLSVIAAKNSDVTYINDIGAVNVLPSSMMFLLAGITAALVFIPMLILIKKGIAPEKSEENEQ